MNSSQYRVAIAYGIHDHPNANEVVDVVELATAHHHFLVNAIELLRATIYLALGFDLL